MIRAGKTFWPVCLALLCLWAVCVEARGAPRRLTGREIFRTQCAKCHGRNGEGVKGKYDDPLRGDHPLDKLIRYIDRNMPDDDPSKCVGRDAEAVGRFIYDAFYSREARLRKNPPRVELVRLTKRQYVNTVADLLKEFTGKDAAISTERGLQAAYFKHKDFGGGNKVFDRVDRQVDFDFGPGGPGEAFTTTNGFAIEWRGSLIADETGDYEFILKTPNGARLWLNDADEPLIDAWVASGTVTEHRATIRLLGGRMYPLRMNYFRFKDKRASISLQWSPPHGTLEPVPARNLTPASSSPTFVVTTPFPADDSSVGYERGVAVSKAWDEATTQAAIETANHVLKHLARLSQTKPDATNRTAKVEAFCEDFVAAAFRRPLTEEQKRALVRSHFAGKTKLEDAVKRVVLLALKSPRFLYLGLAGTAPDDFEIASRLSFALWDSLPDRDLRKPASQGALHTREQVAEQARRMLSDPRVRSKVQDFLHHWLQMDRVESQAKDQQLFPGFTPGIVADLRASLDAFLADAVWNGASDYRTLLQADHLFVNNRLAAFYGFGTNVFTPSPPSTPLAGGATGEGGGLEGGEGHKMTDDFVKVTPAGKERSGVLTHPYLLSAFSYSKSTSPIHRGVFLTRNIVGRSLKPPPIAQTFNEANFAPNLTMREKVTELTRPSACQNCHTVINPLGFSLEQFDAVGRFRTSENEKPIDAASDYVTEEGETVRIAGPRDVAHFALTNEKALDGFIEQLFHALVKQPMLAYGLDVNQQLRRSFVDSGFNLQKLFVEIATLSALHRAPATVAQSKP